MATGLSQPDQQIRHWDSTTFNSIVSTVTYPKYSSLEPHLVFQTTMTFLRICSDTHIFTLHDQPPYCPNKPPKHTKESQRNISNENEVDCYICDQQGQHWCSCCTAVVSCHRTELFCAFLVTDISRRIWGAEFKLEGRTHRTTVRAAMK